MCFTKNFEVLLSEIISSTESPTPWPDPGNSGKVASPGPQFSLSGTLILTCICLSCCGFLIFVHFETPRLSRFVTPEHHLSRVANQVLYLKSGLAHGQDWERELNEAVAGQGGELNQLIEWYSELEVRSSDPLVNLHLAILKAENGQHDAVQSDISLWQMKGQDLVLFSELIHAAYLTPDEKPDYAHLQARLAEAVPDSWFYYQLAGRLAERSDDEKLGRTIRAVLDQRGSRLVGNSNVIGFLEGGGLVVGGMAFLRLIWLRQKNGPSIMRVGESAFPPPWPGWHGVTVLLRGGGIAAILLFAISLSGIQPQTLQVLIPFILHVPILVWASRHLLVPYNVTMVRAMGLKVNPNGWMPLLLISSCLFLLGFVGNWGLGMVAHNADVTIHWTDWFDPTLVEGGVFSMLGALFGYVVLAPVLEEFVFRGVLFATLRRKFSAWPSIIMSAAFFAALHGYGLLGATTIFWSGILWAWAFEKTGSLWPGIIAHALNNLLVCLSVLLLMRPG